MPFWRETSVIRVSDDAWPVVPVLARPLGVQVVAPQAYAAALAGESTIAVELWGTGIHPDAPTEAWRLLAEAELSAETPHSTFGVDDLLLVAGQRWLRWAVSHDGDVAAVALTLTLSADQ